MNEPALAAEVVELAEAQLYEFVAKHIYKNLEPDNPGLRPAEIERKSYLEIATILAGRLSSIKSGLNAFCSDDWKNGFVSKCEIKHTELAERWKNEWIKLCSGKRLIDDIYREYTVRLSKFDFKRRLAKRMKNEQTEDWTLVKEQNSRRAGSMRKHEAELRFPKAGASLEHGRNEAARPQAPRHPQSRC